MIHLYITNNNKYEKTNTTNFNSIRTLKTYIITFELEKKNLFNTYVQKEYTKINIHLIYRNTNIPKSTKLIF